RFAQAAVPMREFIGHKDSVDGSGSRLEAGLEDVMLDQAPVSQNLSDAQFVDLLEMALERDASPVGGKAQVGSFLGDRRHERPLPD
ncbi:hypothetical protein, partial [Bacillus sp. SRB_331]|uniref:hypothetical protein n=1 Tax=Bacillus sp. SRB_331 TaxID=1969379 RepID=UPI000DC56D07